MLNPSVMAIFYERPPAPELNLVGRRQRRSAEDGELSWHVAGPETLGMIAAKQHTTIASLIALNREAYPALVGHPFTGVRGMVLRVR